MIEYVTKILVRKFEANIDEAIFFYYELRNRRKLEHFINHVNDFSTFQEVKLFYLGGN